MKNQLIRLIILPAILWLALTCCIGRVLIWCFDWTYDREAADAVTPDWDRWLH